MSTIVPEIQATHDSRFYGPSNTVIVTFGEIHYYLDQAPAHVISFQPSRPLDGLFRCLKGDVLPCTVIDWSKDQLSKEDLIAIGARCVSHDDVWTPIFLAGETSCRHEIKIKNF